METGDRRWESPPCGSPTGSIRELNDAFRGSLVGGKCVITAGVGALGPVTVSQLIEKVRQHSEFNSENDPYGEHDFGAFEHAGIRFFWKIDYFDASLVSGSEDPTDPTRTTRVLTLMKAEEY